MKTTITWNREKLEKFETAYKKQSNISSTVFLFDGVEYDKVYSKYLISYLKVKLATLQPFGKNIVL